jgi:hypothetical protein
MDIIDRLTGKKIMPAGIVFGTLPFPKNKMNG